MFKDKRNNIYFLVIAVVLFVTAIGTFSFAYINRPTVSGNTNVLTNITDISNSLSLTYSGNTNISLPITLDDLKIDEASNDYSSYISAEGNVTINFSSNATVYPEGATCDYSIVYTPTTVFNASSGATSASLNELTISGTNGTVSFSDLSLAGINSQTTLYSTSVSTSSSLSSVSVPWTFTMKFYNLNVDQSSVLGQSPAGKISVVPGECRGGG